MTDINEAKKEVLDEIVSRGKLGNKKFHSETSLQNIDVDEVLEPSDPGVHNESVNGGSSPEEQDKRRTMSQPGPIAGNMLTATAARTARRRPRNVMYADLDRNDSVERPVLVLPNRDESGSATPISSPAQDRNSPAPYSNLNGNFRNGDAKSLNSYRLYASVNDLRSVGTPRKRSVMTMDAQSIRSVETQAPPPTSTKDKKKHTKTYWTLVMSCMYAVLLVTLGLIFHVADSFIEPSVSLIYSIILSSIGFIYLVYLMIDIGLYKTTAIKNLSIKNDHEEKVMEFFRKQEEEFGPLETPGERTPDSISNMPPTSPRLLPLKHNYCFSNDRHSNGFYVKMGATGFAVGHLIHSMLLLATQVSNLIDENLENDKCVNTLQLALDVIFPFYCILQLYFIFKYSNVIILKSQGAAQFMFMHMIGSSLCFWISAIVRETVLALTIYANSVYGNGGYGKSATNITTIKSNVHPSDNRFFDISSLYNEDCISSAEISSIIQNFSPYLYPFSVEFNILIVASYYIIWSHIGYCKNDDEDSPDDDHSCIIPTANENNDYTSNIVIYADCHASNRALFLGMIVLVVVIGQLIIGYVFSSAGEDLVEVGYLLNDCTKLGLHTLMLISVLLAFNQLRKLDVNTHHHSMLDDVLLFICLPAFFMETLFSLVATVNILNVVKSIDFILMVIQVIIQTPLIIDGLRRCSNAKKLRKTKPGRELLMFLLITNVAMWLFNTFSYKSPESLDERYAYYGKVLWSILGHVSLPLMMFYRFHSSVCFADIWDSAYKPGEDH